ncbi:MAG: calcium/sodium antiporter [Actinomycetota bacterium]|nr:calcium/sodium antiporter [Actinomycetota bacterium]MDP2288172.1 calcium/sodium antiporter [Actinomycetota bacterium]
MIVLALLVGVACAALGGDLFVRGVVSLAAWWRIPAGIIGATVAAFATSSPELSVAVNSALQGNPQIALGDALGSNVVNVGVVLGLALAFGAITVNRGTLARDVPMAFAAPALLGLLALDGNLSQADGLVLLVVFLGWLTWVAVAANSSRTAVVEVLQERSRSLTILSAAAGLALLILAGRLIVIGASGLGEQLGWDGFVVGAVFVALGTSTPEIATMLAARFRGHDDVGVGTVLGSNIFNTLLIVGVTAAISPITLDRAELRLGIAVSMLVVLLALPGRSGRLGRWRSLPLLATYLGTIAVLVTTAQS